MDTETKVYVGVDVTFDADGNMRPAAIHWEDGTVYRIDRIKAQETAAARKAGGCGDRYTVQICGKETYLFFEHSPDPFRFPLGKWFVERN